MAGNKSLHAASKAKNDEFYTQLCDIENELRHYRDHFKGKTVLCNCDDPRQSNFFHYFSYNFEQLGLNRLITTCYKNQSRDLFTENNCEQAIWLEYNGQLKDGKVPDVEDIGIHPFKGDGDFRSPECVELLKQADIVVTNPPFSLFREYLSQLIKYDKKFLIIGNQDNFTYKEVYSLIHNGKMWIGYNNGDMSFKVPSYYEKKEHRFWEDEDGQKWRSMGNISWFTNLEIPKQHEDLVLFKRYSPEKYPNFDNYNAIFVKRVDDIPCDYYGEMGVPVTFLCKYNPDQFELIGLDRYTIPKEALVGGRGAINGKSKYARILIKRRQQ